MAKKSSVQKYEYDSVNSVRVTIKLNRRTDAPILARLEKAPTMSGYIRSLILADIRKNMPELLATKPYSPAADGKQSLKKVYPSGHDFFHPDDPTDTDTDKK